MIPHLAGLAAAIVLSSGLVPSHGRPDHRVAFPRRGDLAVFNRPDDGKAWTRLPAVDAYGEPTVVVTIGERAGWLDVLLSIRPNGSTGWVRAGDVTVRPASPYRVEVERGARRIVIRKGSRVILRARVAVGKPSTPTPAGDFYVTERIPTYDRRGPYGPFAFGLSGHSTVLSAYNGGDGQIGLHGTNQPRLLGRGVSHGCIRIANADIRKLARLLPLGTMVDIH